jgi:hypothetical protein
MASVMKTFTLKGVQTIHRSTSQVRKVGCVGVDSHVVSGQKFHGEKWSVRRYVVVMQQPVLLSPKFGAKSSHIFTQSP